MSVFDHVYYPFHHNHINTPLITPLELQMVGGVSHENWGVITPHGGVWINHWSYALHVRGPYIVTAE